MPKLSAAHEKVLKSRKKFIFFVHTEKVKRLSIRKKKHCFFMRHYSTNI